jgi:hypothetical protein
MATYRCPHCAALMRHKPDLAGERVICSKCGGHYFEPTDPLPGVKPQIAPPAADEAADSAPYSTPASGSSPNLAAALGPTSTSASPSRSPTPKSDSPASSPQPAKSSAAHAQSRAASAGVSSTGLRDAEPQAMLAELERRGMRALLIAWPMAAPQNAGLVVSPQLSREDADKMILDAAFQLIAAKWPELRQLLANYQNQL